MSSGSAKELIFEEESRERLRKGIRKLTEPVACTLGPKGHNVSIERSWGAPTITKDGGNIAKEITFSDQYENMAASMAKEMVQKIKEKCGDGTATGLVLLEAIVNNGIRHISTGTNPTALKRGMDKAVEAIVKQIEKSAKPIKGHAETATIATVSASGNSTVGKMIADASEKAGSGGVIMIQEAKGTESSIEKVEGMRFDRGYISAYFCTNSDKMTVEMENPQLLLIDKKVSNIHELLPLLNIVAQTARSLLIIAEDIEGDALSTLIVNKLRGSLKVAAVKAPGFGDRRKAMMQDIAVLTGATVISEDAGVNMKELNAQHLGSAERISITREQTTIVNGAGKPDEIKARIQQIDHEIAKATSDYDKEKLEERKATLSGGVCVIFVGATTEQEMKLLKSVYEDSLNSTRAALQEGVVPGGGCALLIARKEIAKLELEGDEALGAKIIYKACEAPFKRIVANAGADGAVMLFEVEAKGGSHGFNATTERVEDLMLVGVIDPAKVVKNSLIHAASTAGVVLQTEVLIGTAPEEELEEEEEND